MNLEEYRLISVPESIGALFGDRHLCTQCFLEGAEVTRILEPRKDLQQSVTDCVFPGNPGDQLHSGVPHGDVERGVTSEDTVDAARDDPLEGCTYVRIRLQQLIRHLLQGMLQRGSVLFELFVRLTDQTEQHPLIFRQRLGVVEGAANLTAEKPM